MTIKGGEFDRVVNKFGFTVRKSGDRLAWLEVDGRTIVRTKRSEKRGDLPFQHSIRQQLKLDEQQLRQAIACSFGRAEYLEVLRFKGILQGGPDR